MPALVPHPRRLSTQALGLLVHSRRRRRGGVRGGRVGGGLWDGCGLLLLLTLLLVVGVVVVVPLLEGEDLLPQSGGPRLKAARACSV